MKVALIGASGQLGSDLVRVLKNSKIACTPLTHRQIEVTDEKSISRVLEKIDFDVLINASAYHRVDEIEDNPTLAFAVNTIGAENLAKYCQSRKKAVVFFSTDYVFGRDIKRLKPYLEDDFPGPINMYGISKLSGELATMAFCKKSFVIRSTGLFGAAGSSGKGGNFVETMIGLAETQKIVKVVGDQIVSPTYTFNLAWQVIKILQNGEFGLYHAVSNGSCSWFQFASEIFKMTGKKVHLVKVASADFKTAARRPTYSALGNKKITKLKINVMNTWRENLKLYLLEKKYI